MRRDLTSTTMLRAVLDSAVDGIALADLEGNILLSNRQLVELIRDLGITGRGTVTDRLLSIKDKIVDSERYAATMARLARQPENASIDEFELLDHRVFVGFTSPVRDDEGRLVGRLWTL